MNPDLDFGLDGVVDLHDGPHKRVADVRVGQDELAELQQVFAASLQSFKKLQDNVAQYFNCAKAADKLETNCEEHKLQKAMQMWIVNTD